MSEKVYVCIVCGHTLSEADYLSLPDSADCPECGVSKQDYILMEQYKYIHLSGWDQAVWG